MKLRLGTRTSALALAQSGRVARLLEARGHEVELVHVQTAGDADTARPFAEVGAPGLFVRALEQALIEGQVDFAVHSYKDLPSVSPDALSVAAVPEREDPRDRLLIAPDAFDPDAGGALPLREGARVGTASARRIALLHALRPDVEPAFLRGNVDTRLARLDAGDYDAILLAAAGLNRLAAAGAAAAPERLHAVDLDPTLFVPAPSQGAVACQARVDDTDTQAALAELDDADAHRAVKLERRLLALVEAGCQSPFGAHARAVDPAAPGGLDLFAVLEHDDELRRAHVACAEPAGEKDAARQAYGALFAERRP
ncbi:MAG: hydroxymethylbilane synthase [Planctomycetota bacterium]